MQSFVMSVRAEWMFRLVEGEVLLNDAAVISLFVVLLGIIMIGVQPTLWLGW